MSAIQAVRAGWVARRRWAPGARWAVLMLAIAANGCGGRTGTTAVNPISVSLLNSTVTVQQGGAPVNVQIQIQSTSETAVVSVVGLPAGVGVKYAATDTNPSGLLTFTASAQATKGTFMPMINVLSAGQAASIEFTLVVAM